MLGFKNLISDIATLVKDNALGEVRTVKLRVSSDDHYQKERKRTYEKAGGMDNTLESKTVRVKHEKKNKHDPNALAVYVFGAKIGYIYMSDQDVFNSINKKEQLLVRQFFYNNKYRAELIIQFRGKQ